MEKYIITAGFGNAAYDLNAFDNALLNSGIADYNLIKLSSILPRDCILVDLVDLPKGEFLHTAYSSFLKENPGAIISAAIAIAVPKDKSMPGVIMGFSSECNSDTAELQVTAMVKTAMESRFIEKYDIQKKSVSMVTKEGFNCVMAAVSIW